MINDPTLLEGNSTEKDYPLHKCLHELIEEQAGKTPDKPAVRFEHQQISFSRLNGRSNRCARFLRGLGVGPDVIVGVLMERSVEMVTALVGILKAGGAYLPLDPTHPDERLLFMLQDASVSIILTQDKFKNLLPTFEGTKFSLDSEWDFLTGEPEDDLETVTSPEHLAYVIYTSGSTGRPKGCMLTHKAICNRLLWMQDKYRLTGEDNVLQKTPFTFDVSVWEFFWPLLTGACLVMAKPDGHKDSNYLVDMIRKERITTCHFVPSMLRFFVTNSNVGHCGSLRQVFTSGEALPFELLLAFKKKLPAKLHNLYGPTEAAVDVSYWECDERPDKKAPIGRPISNIQLYVLDQALRLVPAGGEGELHIGGVGLARGYLNRPELTAEKFIKNPFSGDPDAKLYKTGDKARYLPDGNIEYLGRMDFQVKLRGNRVELGEIETVLREHEAIEEAVVLVQDEQSGDPKLVAYIVPAGEAPASKQVREFVRGKLPDYMVPNVVAPLDRMPVTQHGKLDRKALPWPIAGGSDKKDAVKTQPDVNLQESVTAMLLRTFKEVLEPAGELGAEDDLFDSGATSLTMVQVVERIQKTYHVEVPVEVFLDDPTIWSIAGYVSQRIENTAGGNGGDALRSPEAGERPIEGNADAKHAAGTAGAIALKKGEFKAAAYQGGLIRKRCVRRKMTFADFSRFLSLLKQATIQGMPKYLYPSAGGLNAIQTYIYMKENAVKGLERGVYYYHPQEHSLYCTDDKAKIDRSVFFESDRPVFDDAGFVLFFIAQFDAIKPVYQAASPALVTLDAGYMTQLLVGRQTSVNVGICPVAGVDFERISSAFKLDASHQYIHCLLGGVPEQSSSDSHADTRYPGAGDYVSAKGMSGHFRDYKAGNSFAASLEPEAAAKFGRGDFLSKEEHDQFHAKHAHIRRFSGDRAAVALDKYEFPESDYSLRSCRRDYLKKQIPFDQFSRFLFLLGAETKEGKGRRLYPSLSGNHAVEAYLYIKDGGVEGVGEGIYRYDPENHRLLLVTSQLSKIVKTSYTPFNRRHYQKSAFCLFLLAGLDRRTPVYHQERLYFALLEAGSIGQLLMDRQAEFDLGVCPIGGLNFDRIRPDFKLSEGHVLLHSFTCGSFKQEIPPHRDYLETGRGREQDEQKKHIVPMLRKRTPIQHDIAIVGMAGRYPGARSLGEYWENLQAGKSCFQELPESRRKLLSQNRPAPERMPLKGAFLEDIDCFDGLLFNISPSEARMLDPQERLFLEAAWECLEHAGYTAENLKAVSPIVGVFAGAMWSDYQNQASANRELNAEIPPMALHSSIANRVSYFFHFNGPSVAINTSCSSAVTALHFACESIKRGECDAALVGGVNVIAHSYHADLLTGLELLSQDGACRPLGANASGWLAGEGVGAVLIKPLEDAERDRDHIHAVIKGTAVGHSGKTVRFGAPSSLMQSASIQKALNDAGVSPQSVSYIETAAAGSGIADASEINAIKKVFQGRDPAFPLLVGTVKANIGHLESASAMSQLTKVLFQMKHGRIAPTINFKPVNPLLQLEGTGIEIADSAKPWPVPLNSDVSAPRAPLRALINAFGATGSGGHIVLEEYATDQGKETYDSKLTVVPFSAATKEQLAEQAKRLHEFLSTNQTSYAISDIGYTLQIGRTAMEERLALVADTVQGLTEALGRHLQGEMRVAGVYQGRVSGREESAAKNEHTDLHSMARQWTLGAAVQWNAIHSGNERRVPLPGYPFAKDRHWVKEYPGEADDGGRSTEDPVRQAAAAATLDTTRKDGRQYEHALLCRIEDYLKSLFSEVSEIPVSRVDARAALEKYGISSLMIKTLNAGLERDFGELSRTLFFEYQSIHELAKYFLEHHRSRLQTLFDRAEPLCGTASRKVSPAMHAPAREKPSARSCDRGREAGGRADIAIIGLSGRYPKARTVAEYWENLKNGVDCIAEIPAARWDHRRYYSPEKHTPGKTHSKWGGFLEDIDGFDAFFFNISPREAELMDPQERLFLQTVWHTIEDAGYNQRALKEAFNGKVGVFVGVMYGEYHLLNEDGDARRETAVVSSSFGSIAHRVSYIHDFHGPSMAIDTMCSSSLTALHLAVESIRRGECGAAIAGGVNLSIHPSKYLLHSQFNMSSSDGRCRSFGEGGDGFVPGEGVGAVLLKPLHKALQDGDHIYGIIKGASVNHGGKTNGYMVPNPSAQGELISDVLEKADIDPRMISYVEAHGTGTSLGDPIEITGLSRSFAQYTSDKQFCSIGSVKSNIGHLEAAAGIAGLTKVLLQMRHKQLVPSLHAGEINTNIKFENTPFFIQQELTEWKQPVLGSNGNASSCPRLAGLSSFGAGGANAHVLIQEHIADETRVPPPITVEKPALVLLSAKDEDRLKEQARQLLSAVKNRQLPDCALADIAYTLQVGREAMEERLGLLTTSITELEEKLTGFLEGQEGIKDLYRGRLKPNSDLAVLTEDEELRETLEKWIERGKYSKILDLWVRGLTFDWSRLHGDTRPRRISLPVYPFACQRYWIPRSRGRRSENSRQVVTAPSSRQPEPARSELPVGTGKPVCITLRPLTERQTAKAGTADGQARKQVTLSPLGMPCGPSGTTDEQRPTELSDAAETGGPLLEALSASLAEALYMKRSDIDTEKNFADMGMDSIIGVEYIRAVNKRYGTSIPATRVYDYPTLRDFARFMEMELKKVPGGNGERPRISRQDRSSSGSAPEAIISSKEPSAPSGLSAAGSMGAELPDAPGLSRRSLEEQLSGSLAEALYMKRSDIVADKNFADMGLDSIIGVEWIRAVNKGFGTSIPATRVYDYPTIRDFARFMEKELAKTGRALKQPAHTTNTVTALDDLLRNVQEGALDVEQADRLLREIHFQGERP